MDHNSLAHALDAALVTAALCHGIAMAIVARRAGAFDLGTTDVRTSGVVDLTERDPAVGRAFARSNGKAWQSWRSDR